MGLIPGAPDADNLVAEQRPGRRLARGRGGDRAPAAGRRLGPLRRRRAERRDRVERSATPTWSTCSPRPTPPSAPLSWRGLYAQNAGNGRRRTSRRAQAAKALTNVEGQLAELPPADAGRLARARAARGHPAPAHARRTSAPAARSIIQRGFVPASESNNPIQTVVLGVLFGLLLGVGLALVREQSDRKLRRTEQVTAAFDAPVLTTVPRSRALKRHKPFADLPPQVAEAFRMLQMNLRFARDEPVRSVLVTSARTGEGKTTISWNLAAAAASGGLSVALVEADLRRPSLAEPLRPRAGAGARRRRCRARCRSRPRCRRSCRFRAARTRSGTRARCT